MAWVAGYVMRQFTCPKAVTHPSTNRARCRATVLIETNALTPNRQPMTMTTYVYDSVSHSRVQCSSLMRRVRRRTKAEMRTSAETTRSTSTPVPTPRKRTFSDTRASVEPELMSAYWAKSASEGERSVSMQRHSRFTVSAVRRLNLRFDGRSTAVRLPIKGSLRSR